MKTIIDFFLENIEVENFDDEVENFMKDWTAERSTSVFTNSDYEVYSFVKNGYEVNIYTNGFSIYSVSKKINFWAELNSNNRVVKYRFI